MKEVVFLIGNGFNYLIKDLINNLNTDNNPELLGISENINQITQLWKKFDDFLNVLLNQHKSLNHEELIRLIETVIDFLSNLEEINKLIPSNKIHLEAIKESFEGIILSKILEISKEFEKHQDNDEYKKIKSLFSNFGEDFKALINNKNISKLSIFTTNYDGIIDTLLSSTDSGFFTDGFYHPVENYKERYIELVDSVLNGSTKIRGEELKYFCFHLHGSYKFERKSGKTYKLKSGNKCNSPSMIFNNPDVKEEQIKRDSSLSEYYQLIIKGLCNTDKFIIFGNSLKTEPHIKKLIWDKNCFNKAENTIYLISPHPDEIEKQLENKNLPLLFTIEKRSTNNIKDISELIKLFDEIF